MSSLTVREVAKDLQISTMSVYRLIHSGELLGIRVGRLLRIPEEAYGVYLKHLRRQGPGMPEGMK
jgi:excisionase family DNA binding protein